MKLSNVDNFDIVYRLHASKRMFERAIKDSDIEYLLKSGDIIEEYPDDYPLPSYLINGYTLDNRPLHIVVAINKLQKELIIVTVYEPNPIKWLNQFSRRIK